jgi:UDP-2-acetamido-3-amino-2,3-dideoxy-glucuronate N-acetyltransferase
MASTPLNDAPYRLISDVTFGERVVVRSFTNLYGCRIGDETQVGPFVEIQRGAVVGARCKIQSHTFICDGVQIGDRVFIGHGVMFVNDKFPKATNGRGDLAGADEWTLLRVRVEDGATIGLRRGHPRRRHDRSGCARRGGRGGHARRRAR